MKKFTIILIILMSLIIVIRFFNNEHVKIKNKILSKTFLKQNIPIIDIRTKREWRETGVLPNSYLITFYKENKSFNEKEFMQKLEKIVTKKDTFAILCRSGNRSNRVSRFLNSKGFINVINLSGGIKQGIKNKVNFNNLQNNI